MTGTVCHHCGTEPTARRVETRPQPVTLALCDCDFARCRNAKCRRTTRGLPANARHCPDCSAAL